MINKLFLASFVSIAIGLCAVSGFAADSPLSVAGFEGTVQVKIAPSTEWTDAVVGQILGKNDAVKTGADGMTMLRFADKSTVALKANTEVTIEDLVWDETTRKAGLAMPMGEMRVILKKLDGKSEFKVRTPTAICGARGTVFYIMTTGVETRVFVTENSVDFTDMNGNSYVVVENMTAITNPDGTIATPRELTGDERDQALAGWSGVIAETYIEPPSDGLQTGNDEGDGPQDLGGTPESPTLDNKGQQESEASPI